MIRSNQIKLLLFPPSVFCTEHDYLVPVFLVLARDINVRAFFYSTAIVAFPMRHRGLSLCRHREEDIRTE